MDEQTDNALADLIEAIKYDDDPRIKEDKARAEKAEAAKGRFSTPQFASTPISSRKGDDYLMGQNGKSIDYRQAIIAYDQAIAIDGDYKYA